MGGMVSLAAGSSLAACPLNPYHVSLRCAALRPTPPPPRLPRCRPPPSPLCTGSASPSASASTPCWPLCGSSAACASWWVWVVGWVEEEDALESASVEWGGRGAGGLHRVVTNWRAVLRGRPRGTPSAAQPHSPVIQHPTASPFSRPHTHGSPPHLPPQGPSAAEVNRDSTSFERARAEWSTATVSHRGKVGRCWAVGGGCLGVLRGCPEQECSACLQPPVGPASSRSPPALPPASLNPPSRASTLTLAQVGGGGDHQVETWLG